MKFKIKHAKPKQIKKVSFFSKNFVLFLGAMAAFLAVYLFPFGQDLVFMAVKDLVQTTSDEVAWFWIYIICFVLFIFAFLTRLIYVKHKRAEIVKQTWGRFPKKLKVKKRK